MIDFTIDNFKDLNIQFPPTKIIFGNNAISRLIEEIKILKGNRVLIVTDKQLVRLGLLDQINSKLRKENIDFYVFDEVIPNPPISQVENAIKFSKDKDIDLIIGFGGGSSLDTAKIVAIMSKNEGKIIDYIGLDKINKFGLPKILIPTTSGSGSEVSHSAVLTDERDGNKKVIYGFPLFAEVALIDPILTLNLPPKITSETGMDALTHAIEGFVSWKSNMISDYFAAQSISLIAKYLRPAYARGEKSIESRYNMSLASTLAVMALVISAGGGAVHGLSYPVGAKSHRSHGESIAILLPYVMNFNLIGNVHKFAIISKLMGYDNDNLNEIEMAKNSIKAVKELSKDIHLPQRMRDINIQKDEIISLTEIAFKNFKYHFDRNPRRINPESAKKIYENAW